VLVMNNKQNVTGERFAVTGAAQVRDRDPDVV
jgi:hypothetical protein